MQTIIFLMQKFLHLFDTSSVKRISFREDINGLRAIAVLAVVFYHSEFQFFKGGWLGVDIFFVISGYLISNIIISDLNSNNFSFKDFYLKRVKRILPALFSTLLLSFPFAYWLLTPKAMLEYAQSLIASLVFYSNYYFQNLDFYIAEPAKYMPLIHTWSLAIEEQYYLLFPMVAFILYKYLNKYFGLSIGILIVISILLNSTMSGAFKFYQLQYRLWELLLGVLIMILHSNIKVNHLEKIGFPLILFSIYYFDDATYINQIESKLVATIGVALVIFSNHEESYLSKFLQLRGIKFIGLISYSIYLLHNPAFTFYRIFLNNSNILIAPIENNSLNIQDILVNSTTESPSTISYFIILVFIVLIASLMYKHIETSSKRLSIVLILLPIIAFAAIYTTYDNSTYRYVDSKYLSATAQEEPVGDFLCWNQFKSLTESTTTYEDCFVDNNSDKNLIFLGDSSIIVFAKFFEKNQTLAEDYNYVFLSTMGRYFFNPIDVYSDCKNCILNNIRNDNSIIIFSHRIVDHVEDRGSIYFTENQSYSEASNDFKNYFESLREVNKNIIVIEPYPEITSSPREVLLNKELFENKNFETLYLPYSLWIENSTNTGEILDFIKGLNTSIVETVDKFCEIKTNQCITYNKPNLIYLDRTHINSTGVELILDDLVSVIKRTLSH